MRALVVEAVRDLVPDDRADRPVVDRRRVAAVEERRLQDARREGCDHSTGEQGGDSLMAFFSGE